MNNKNNWFSCSHLKLISSECVNFDIFMFNIQRVTSIIFHHIIFVFFYIENEKKYNKEANVNIKKIYDWVFFFLHLLLTTKSKDEREVLKIFERFQVFLKCFFISCTITSPSSLSSVWKSNNKYHVAKLWIPPYRPTRSMISTIIFFVTKKNHKAELCDLWVWYDGGGKNTKKEERTMFCISKKKQWQSVLK